MVTDFDRNVRTLILSFVIAIMAMIPLRFVEAGQEMVIFSSATVLGESTEEIVLPETPMIEEYAPVLEAPYDEIEFGVMDETQSDVQWVTTDEEDNQVLGATTECISPDNAQEIISGISQQIARGSLSNTETQRMLAEILSVQNSICR